jgi:hypothetical protein
VALRLGIDRSSASRHVARAEALGVIHNAGSARRAAALPGRPATGGGDRPAHPGGAGGRRFVTRPALAAPGPVVQSCDPPPPPAVRRTGVAAGVSLGSERG